MTIPEMYSALNIPFATKFLAGMKSPILVFSKGQFLICPKKFLPVGSIVIMAVTAEDVISGPDRAKWDRIIAKCTRLLLNGDFDTPRIAGQKAFKNITGKDMF